MDEYKKGSFLLSFLNFYISAASMKDGISWNVVVGIYVYIHTHKLLRIPDCNLKNLITWASIEAILQVYLVSFLAFLLLRLLRVWLVCQNP